MEDVHSIRLPKKLSDVILGYSYFLHPYSESQAKIYKLTHKSKPNLYLKIKQFQERNNLKTEYQILKWIDKRLPTPQPRYYLLEEETEYLVTTEVPGTPTYQVDNNQREKAVIILGKSLKLIHNLDTVNCPVNNSIENWLKRLNAEVKDVSFLKTHKPRENMVFTHGDYCLPNIIVKDSELSGIIDWDYAGLADSYTDFASCVRSIRYNYGVIESNEKWIPLFFNSYGLNDLNIEKLDYYSKLIDIT